MSQPTPLTIAKGDGIGPEIMDAVLHILNEGGANLKSAKPFTKKVCRGVLTIKHGIPCGGQSCY